MQQTNAQGTGKEPNKWRLMTSLSLASLLCTDVPYPPFECRESLIYEEVRKA